MNAITPNIIKYLVKLGSCVFKFINVLIVSNIHNNAE